METRAAPFAAGSASSAFGKILGWMAERGEAASKRRA